MMTESSDRFSSFVCLYVLFPSSSDSWLFDFHFLMDFLWSFSKRFPYNLSEIIGCYFVMNLLLSYSFQNNKILTFPLSLQHAVLLIEVKYYEVLFFHFELLRCSFAFIAGLFHLICTVGWLGRECDHISILSRDICLDKGREQEAAYIKIQKLARIKKNVETKKKGVWTTELPSGFIFENRVGWLVVWFLLVWEMSCVPIDLFPGFRFSPLQTVSVFHNRRVCMYVYIYIRMCSRSKTARHATVRSRNKEERITKRETTHSQRSIYTFQKCGRHQRRMIVISSSIEQFL